jgi:zinc transporter 5/7
MFVEIVVGWLTNSLGLISDAGHMFFDNASLFIGLYASYMARWKADESYTYGYARYEVLAGFVNAIFLIFVALSVVFEALERLWEPPEIHGEHVLPVSVLGLAVNIVGLVFFHDFAHGHGDHGHSHGPAPSSSHGHAHGGDAHGHAHSGGTCPSEAKSDHGHAHGGPALSDVDRAAQESHNENMQGVFLHVLADALGSVGVICSSLLIKYFGWNLADPIASLFISILILLSVVPLIKATASPLLSRVPLAMESGFRNAVQQINRLGDVVAVEQPHIWKQHADVIVVTIHVRVRADADEQKVLRQAKKILASAGANVVTVQIEREGHHPAAAPIPPQNSADTIAVAVSNATL